MLTPQNGWLRAAEHTFPVGFVALDDKEVGVLGKLLQWLDEKSVHV
jgi:hypothetical protein